MADSQKRCTLGDRVDTATRLHLDGMPSASVIYGYDAERTVRDVRIENLVIAGKRAKDAESANIVIGDFVTGVRIE